MAEKVDEGLAEIPLHLGMLLGIDQDDAILVEQPPVAFDQDLEIAAILEGDPGAAISQDIGVHR